MIFKTDNLSKTLALIEQPRSKLREVSKPNSLSGTSASRVELTPLRLKNLHTIKYTTHPVNNFWILLDNLIKYHRRI